MMETNIKKGKSKEELFLSVSTKCPSTRLERLKINRLQEIPQKKTKIRISKEHHPLKFILLGFVFIYTLFYITYFWVFKKLKGRSLVGGD